MLAMRDRLTAADRTVISLLRRWSIPALRLTLGIVFVWFGALKVFGVTPVTDLVAATVYWVDPDWFVPTLGVFEVAVGIGLITGKALRITIGAMAVQLLGTFLVLIVLPEVSFQDGNVLLLTVEGEFVIKNLVLLAAGMVIGSTIQSRDETATVERELVDA